MRPALLLNALLLAGATTCGPEARWGGVAGGEVQRELRRWRRCGGPGDDSLAQAVVAGEHAVIAGHVEAGRRDQGAEAGEELVVVVVASDESLEAAERRSTTNGRPWYAPRPTSRCRPTSRAPSSPGRHSGSPR